MKKTIPFAHRGSCELWPENTLHAFEKAGHYNCRHIETDIRLSRDGEIVIFHDETLERTTNGTGKISDKDWKELQQLDAAYNFNPQANFPLRSKGIRIPSLQEAMETFPQMKFNLDLKQAGMEKAVAQLIERNNYHDRVCLASFHGRRIRRCRKMLSKPVEISSGSVGAVFYWFASRIGISLSPDISASQVPLRQWNLTFADQKFIQAAHRAGIQVHVWVVNEPGDMQRLIGQGADGIVTDRIDLLNEILS